MFGEGIKCLLADGFEVPSIDEFFPAPFAFTGTIFELNRLELIRFVVAIALVLIMFLATRNLKVVPGRVQAGLEFVYDFVKKNILELMIYSPKEQRRFHPYIFTLFLTVLFMNLAGIVPGLNLAGTAGIAMPLMIAVCVLVTYWYVGIKAHGFFGFIKHETMPKGVPVPVLFIIGPIEMLQLVLIKPFSLTVRLFANMIAGHILIALCVSFTNMLWTSM
ncbi:MAG: F0F1 ATP synthase subunit A, partial [Bifidobacteriaceae bacterium]|nr:F0F1 ATP synthase subunit A [Bifidobacteriaceae bacterium]